ncbi:MAG: hypothetical protein Q7S22_08510 [Candidatus Micrarchaeota archaeon]|nr:hypothetical protein [Candidatus Micrarchaeota archaeon]
MENIHKLLFVGFVLVILLAGCTTQSKEQQNNSGTTASADSNPITDISNSVTNAVGGDNSRVQKIKIAIDQKVGSLKGRGIDIREDMVTCTSNLDYLEVYRPYVIAYSPKNEQEKIVDYGDNWVGSDSLYFYVINKLDKSLEGRSYEFLTDRSGALDQGGVVGGDLGNGITMIRSHKNLDVLNDKSDSQYDVAYWSTTSGLLDGQNYITYILAKTKELKLSTKLSDGRDHYKGFEKGTLTLHLAYIPGPNDPEVNSGKDYIDTAVITCKLTGKLIDDTDWQGRKLNGTYQAPAPLVKDSCTLLSQDEVKTTCNQPTLTHEPIDGRSCQFWDSTSDSDYGLNLYQTNDVSNFETMYSYGQREVVNNLGDKSYYIKLGESTFLITKKGRQQVIMQLEVPICTKDQAIDLMKKVLPRLPPD